ncbi:DUF4221 family protein [Belliella aquatica]|uniref:DUF4221 domain-containing protein n=1 Tax=Belliella aquatica TaxID=1323734 RepID=A0ABQ1MME8_9BACT|nr:DUF4221 family protein [Belliella aquatica]MCH7405291.1 DUF4221 family protein [Belliella aquatica]GGC42842.1 hypothetical protein GCM10010993_21760 [Belliella aquatica]
MKNAFKWIFIFVIFFSCKQSQDSESETVNSIALVPVKEVSIDLGNTFPKLHGNPIFLNDGGRPYFFIQSMKGIGKFDLRKGGEAVEILELGNINGYVTPYESGYTYITPLENNRYLSYHNNRAELYLIDNNEIKFNTKISKYDPESFLLSAGVYRSMDFNEGVFYGLYDLPYIYAGPPFKYEDLTQLVMSLNVDQQKAEKLFQLPETYLMKNVNILDMIISFVKNPDTGEYIINFPVTDEIYITKDFVEVEQLTLSPKKDFVDMSNRKGERPGEWKKEYYTGNAFRTVYYDPFRKLIVRHYRKALSENEFNRISQDSFKMLDEKHENRLLFSDLEGNILGDIDVSAFNHFYMHFAEEGMYILNDTDLIGEENMTFTLFEINLN